MAAILLITQSILRFAVFLLWCLLSPFLQLQSLKRRKQLPPIRNKTLLLSGTELARRIRERKIGSEEVVKSFIERCKEVNPILNAIVEARFEAAIQEARDVDTFLRSTEKSEDELAEEMPLLGLPITVKESIAVKGMSHSVGVKKKIPDRAREDALVIKKVREAGGIVILVSNTPEFCMYWETYNSVTGITYNPYDTRKVAGGSSGGEAALLGSGASILGVGSDIAGSARLPAMFCGIFGHKPTARWVPCQGHRPESTEEVWSLYFTLGSMVRYAEDLPLLLKVMASTPEVKNCFDRKVPVQDIRIFYAESENSMIASSIDREIVLAIRKLKEHIEAKYNVKVQKADLSELRFSFNISVSLLLKMDGVETVFSKENDPKEWGSVGLEMLKFLCGMSSHTLPAILYGVVKRTVDKFPTKYLNNMSERASRLRKQLEDLLGVNGVLIYPSFRSSAYYPYETFYNPTNFQYMMIYNALGFPVTQCPLGLDRKGLPIGVQIVGNAGSDHLTIAVAQEIQRAFGGWQPPSSEKTV